MATTTSTKQLTLTQFNGSDFSVPVPVTVTEEFPEGVSGDTLPTVAVADAGKGLKVDAQGKWVAANFEELPAVTVADAGKVLLVDAEGHWTVGTVG